MKNAFAKVIHSGQWQLNAAGLFILGLLAFNGWALAQHLSIANAFPLALIAYAAWRIIFELTFNRANVPTLAMSFSGRAKVTRILQEAAQSSPHPYAIIDLGSGRGELTRCIARAIPGARVTGIETARLPYLQSAFVQRALGPANLNYKQLDFWPYDCSGADAVLLYLNQRLATQAGEKLHKELRPGSIVISRTFPLLGVWHPIETIEFRTPFKETIYVYRKD